MPHSRTLYEAAAIRVGFAFIRLGLLDLKTGFNRWERMSRSSKFISIDAGFDLTISTKRDRTIATGHVSALWKGREAGFECYPPRIADLEETYSLDFGGPWAQVLSFRYSTLTGCAGALIVGAVYASATEGILFETEDLKFFKALEAIARARECEVEEMRIEDLQADILRKVKRH